MTRIKLAIDAHQLEGQRTGVGRYLENILKAWVNYRDLAITLIFKDDIPPDQFLREPIFVCQVAPRLGFSSTALFQHFGLLKVIARLKPDIFWGPSYLLPVLHQGKSLLTIHDIIYETHPGWYSWPSAWDKIFLKAAGRWAAKKASHILVPSEFTKSEIISAYGLPPNRLTVTPLAPDPRFKPAEKPNDEMFRRFGIGGRYVLFVGALINRRCLTTLMAAFQLIEREFPKLQLVLAGPDFLDPPIDFSQLKWCVRIPYADTVQLRQLYSFATVTVALSRYEGFGLPIIEAMACGSPVIASATGALPEVMGRAALAVSDPTDAPALAKALGRPLGDKALAATLRRQSLRQARHFTWTKTALATRQIINKLHAGPA